MAVGRERTRRNGHRVKANAKPRHAVTILRPVAAHRCADHRCAAQELQRVSNVARATTKLAPHVFNQKRHVDFVRRSRNYVIREFALKHTNSVKGHRATNEDAGFLHDRNFSFVERSILCRSVPLVCCAASAHHTRNDANVGTVRPLCLTKIHFNGNLHRHRPREHKSWDALKTERKYQRLLCPPHRRMNILRRFGGN